MPGPSWRSRRRLGVGDFGWRPSGCLTSTRGRSPWWLPGRITRRTHWRRGRVPRLRVRSRRRDSSPEGGDVKSEYGGFDGQVAAYLGNPRAHLAIRAAAGNSGRVHVVRRGHRWGVKQPGLPQPPFSGDSSLYGTASLRDARNVGLKVIALRFGLVGLAMSDGCGWTGDRRPGTPRSRRVARQPLVRRSPCTPRQLQHRRHQVLLWRRVSVLTDVRPSRLVVPR